MSLFKKKALENYKYSESQEIVPLINCASFLLAVFSHGNDDNWEVYNSGKIKNPESLNICRVRSNNSSESASWIGSGNYGTVFKVVGGSEPLVIKVCRFDTNDYNYRRMTQDEFIEAAKKERDHMIECANNPNIMPLFGCVIGFNNDDEDNSYALAGYIMPECIVVSDLAKTVSEPLYIELCKSMCNALEECRSNYILHRDIKFANMFKYNRNFVLGDFGSSIKYHGTERYTAWISTNGNDSTSCAPECQIEYLRHNNIDNEIDLKGRYNSDIYLLGRALSHLSYHDGDLTDNLNLFSTDFRKIIEKMLNPNPKDRYQTATEILNALNNINTAENFGDELKASYDIHSEIEEVINCIRVAKTCADNDPDIIKAVDITKKGMEKGIDNFYRLYSYIQYFCIYLYYKDKKNRTEEQLMGYINNALSALDYLCINDDALAISLRTVIKKECKLDGYDRVKALQKLDPCAERGCTLAQYFYAIYAYKDNAVDIDKVAKYLSLAIENGFSAALCTAYKIANYHPEKINNELFKEAFKRYGINPYRASFDDENPDVLPYRVMHML